MAKAIETIYNGYRFRSRLEARWAIFFDTLGIEYQYELEGFDLGEVGWYLPDFYLPRVEMWAEVKPAEFNEDELEKIKALARFTTKPCLMLIGTPARKAYYAWYTYPNGADICNYALSHYHNYYTDEKRFFAAFLDDEILEDHFDDMDKGIIAARQARFEHGEKGASNVR